MSIGRITLMMSLTIFTSACGFFSRPDNHFYSLETIAGSGPAVAISGPPLAIDGVELPPTLARRGIVVRGDDNRLEVRGTHQWAAPLESMLLHTLGFNLANRLPEGMVVLPGQPKPAGATRSLFVIFEELAPGPDATFILDGRWTLNDVTRHERIAVPLQSDESADVAAAMSQALATLADRIALLVAGHSDVPRSRE